MAKFQLLLAFLFLTIVTISAMAIDGSNAEDSTAEDSIADQPEEYWSCYGGNNACSASCAFRGRWRGGYCNRNRVCICN